MTRGQARTRTRQVTKVEVRIRGRGLDPETFANVREQGKAETRLHRNGAPAPRNRLVRPPERERPWLERARDALSGARFPAVTGGSDSLLFGAVVALIVFGVVMVYSASSVRAVRVHGNGHYFMVRQAFYAVAGLTLTYVLSRTDYHRLRRLGLPALLVSAVLLIVVKLTGRHAGGAVRWIQLGPIHVQPAEVAKLALILWLAESLAQKGEQVRRFTIGFLPHVLMVGMLVGLCIAQPDFGSSAILVLLMFILLFVAGVRLGYVLMAAGLLLPLAYLALRLVNYRWDRIVAFTDPFKYRMTGGYQIVESWVSFGAGGLTGVGLGDSRQKLLFLPEAHTDFIAAIVAEELGFVGFGLLVLGFVIVVLRGLRAGFRAPDDQGLYLGVGLTTFIGLSAVTNLAVVLGLLPTKGLTLPFLSFGGSSLLVNCVAVGILLNVSRPRRSLETESTAREGGSPPSAAKQAQNRRTRAVHVAASRRLTGASAEGGLA
jgi:cell division protein FtsW